MINFSQVLKGMGSQLDLHAKFLNTLSLLEYIGARKILKSQLDCNITEELLGHITEEIRHSQVLKRLALTLSRGELKTFHDRHLLSGQDGKAYIQSVDHAAAKLLPKKNEWMNYLLTTLVVEERAAQVYPIYNDHLGQLGYPNKLLSIVRDEDKHLKSVLESLSPLEPTLNSIIETLRGVESNSFDRFMEGISLHLR